MSIAMKDNKTASKRPLVLVADDDDIVLDMIETFLEKNGYDSVLAENGHEAVEAFQNTSS